MAVFEVLLFFAGFDFVKGRLRDVNVAAFNQLGHLTVEQREQQCADVSAVDVRVGHDDDAVVTQFVRVEIIGPAFAIARTDLPDTRTQRRDQREDLVAG